MTRNDLILGVVLEERFRRLPDGTTFSPSGFGDGFWHRYLSTFDRIAVIGRVADAEQAEPGWAEIRDSRVLIRGLTSYVGPDQFLRAFPTIYRSFRKACEGIDIFVVRAPGTLSILMFTLNRGIKGKRRVVAVELVGDPVDVFGSGVGGPLRALYRLVFKRMTQQLCLRASAVSYVTRFTLQDRYPAAKGALTIACSSIDLPREIIEKGPRRCFSSPTNARPTVAFTAASLEVPYKGIEVLIAAVSHLNSINRPLQVRIAGDGRLRPMLESMAENLGVRKNIIFLGRLSRDSVLEEMRSADIYVQPSLTEGLPRAVIEACATAAPIVASNVGGIPELLHPDDLVPPGDSRALAELMLVVYSDPARMRLMSERNLRTAQDYESSVLEARRLAFYRELRRIAIKGRGD